MNQEQQPVKALNKAPYLQAYYPPKPTKITRYMRVNLIWQLIRFFVLNFKMIKLLTKGH